MRVIRGFEMKIRFEEMRSPEVGELVEKKGMVILPIGACEEHGRHLPVSTDTTMAYRAALEAAERVAGNGIRGGPRGRATRKAGIPVAVLPPVWFGYTMAILKNWPGTVTVKARVLIDLLIEICRSLVDMGFEKILIVNGHGNNLGVLDVVVRTVGDEFKVFPGLVSIFDCWDKEFLRKNRKSKEGGIGHACEAETSVMLHLTDLVDMSVADDTDIMTSDLRNCPVDMASSRKKRFYLTTWHLENSTYGGAGDPSAATKEFGEKIHAMTVDALVDIIEEFYEVQTKLAKRRLKRPSTRF
jgi:creatinine amidohydrolase